MSNEMKQRLLEAAKTGTIEDVRAAYEACSAYEREEYGEKALWHAAGNEGSCALEIMEFLIVRGVKPNSCTLYHAAENNGPDALDIVDYLMELGVKPDSGTLEFAAGNEGSCALEIVELLMERNVEPDTVAFEKATGNPGPHALEIVKRLIKQGLLEGIRKYYIAKPLYNAVKNHGFHALDMVKFLIKRRLKPSSYTLFYAAENPGPCALDIVKLLIERQRMDPSWKDTDGNTVFTASLYHGNPAISDYLFSRDDFLLSDLMPRPEQLPVDTYKTYRDKAISRTNELIDAKGIVYAKTVAADIEKILKTENPKPTKEDVEMLQSLVRKIVSRDWVAGAQVKCDDFLRYEVERSLRRKSSREKR